MERLTEEARKKIEDHLAAGNAPPDAMPDPGTPRPWRLPDREYGRKK